MEIIKIKDINKNQISKIYNYFYKLPNHGFLDFSKNKKNFEKEFIDILNNKKFRFLIEIHNEEIQNYILIKNENSINRSVVMTKDVGKLKNNLTIIKEFSGSNNLEIGIRNHTRKEMNKISFLTYLRTYNFMKLEIGNLFNSNDEDSILKLKNYKQYYKDLLSIQNDCFADQYGYEANDLLEFKKELQNLEKRGINSYFEITKSNDEWSGYAWTQLNEENNEGRLSMCGIKKKFRNRGLAKPLIISSINNLIINNCEVIYLEVDNQNEPAKKIYSDLGFKKYSKLDWYVITN
ncbi:MAG: hypothetical protein CL893_02110 [Dehalococcoidia bacterium]|nr:hypothetical protein [Dehalococcoidia bacterium]